MSESTERIRDAERSRETILRAAEKLFAERGFDGASLSQIATAAGLSRGAPSYFFGSKEQLYRAVLEQVFKDREEATRRACEPLIAWANSEKASVQTALTKAVDGYFDFLLKRPSFLKLIQREEMGDDAYLKDVPRESRAIEDAFTAVREARRKRGLKPFDVQDAVFLFVSLTFFPLAQHSTFMASLGQDLNDKAARRKHVRLAVDQLLHLIGSGKSP